MAYRLLGRNEPRSSFSCKLPPMSQHVNQERAAPSPPCLLNTTLETAAWATSSPLKFSTSAANEMMFAGRPTSSSTLHPTHFTRSSIAPSALQGVTCAEQAVQIRDEITKINSELAKLEAQELDAQETFRRLEAEKEMQRRQKEQEEMNFELKEEKELQLFKAKAREDRLTKQRNEAILAEAVGSSVAPSSSPSPKLSPYGMTQEGGTTLEEYWQTKSMLRGELQDMYAEIRDLEEPSWVRKQRMREKVASAERMDAIAEFERARNKAPPPKVSGSRQEIIKLQEELAALERQDKLADERRRAAEEHNRLKQGTSSERRAQDMELPRAKSALQEATSPKEEERHQRKPCSAAPARRVQGIGLSPLPGRTSTAPSRMDGRDLLFSDADWQKLQTESERFRKARHKKDIDLLRAERTLLLQEDEEAQRLRIHQKLAAQLKREADSIKEQLSRQSSGLPNWKSMTLSSLLQPGPNKALMPISSPTSPIGETSPFMAPDGNNSDPYSRLQREQGSSKALIPISSPTSPAGETSPLGAPVGTNSDLYGRLQREQKEALAEMEVFHLKRFQQTATVFAKSQARRDHVQEVRAALDAARWAEMKDRESHLYELERKQQKLEITKMKERLRMLEDEDLQAKNQSEEMSNKRQHSKVQETPPTKEEPAIAQESSKDDESSDAMNDLEERVKQIQLDRQKEQMRWSRATFPEERPATNEEDQAARRIQRLHHIWQQRSQAKEEAPTVEQCILEEERQHAAELIQGLKRMNDAKQEAIRRRLTRKQHNAAIKIQGLQKIRSARREAMARRQCKQQTFRQGNAYSKCPPPALCGPKPAEAPEVYTMEVMPATVSGDEAPEVYTMEVMPATVSGDEAPEVYAMEVMPATISGDEELFAELPPAAPLYPALCVVYIAVNQEEDGHIRRGPSLEFEDEYPNIMTIMAAAMEDEVDDPELERPAVPDSCIASEVPVHQSPTTAIAIPRSSPSKAKNVPPLTSIAEMLGQSPPRGTSDTAYSLTPSQQALVEEIQKQQEELDQVRAEKERQQLQIERMNEVLSDQQRVIQELREQALTLAPIHTAPNVHQQAQYATAATKIQALWRGHRDRLRLASAQTSDMEWVYDQFISTGELSAVNGASSPMSGVSFPAQPLCLMQPPPARHQYWAVIQNEAAILIQAHWRGYLTRHQLLKSKELALPYS